jgi:hypothetical protein
LYERAIAPLFLIKYYRCGGCKNRFATFGFGKGRVIFRQKSSWFIRSVLLVILFAVIVEALLILLVYR